MPMRSGRLQAPGEFDPFFLRRMVFIALAGVFLVFVVTRAGLLWWEYGRTLANEQRRVENLAHVLAEHLDRTFGAIESAVNQLSVHSDRIGGPAAAAVEWSRVLEATLSGLSGVGSLNVLDADGLVVVSTNPAVTGTSRRDRYLHRRLRDAPGDRLVVGPAAPAEHISGIRIPIGRALHDAQGKFVGFIAATFQPERLRGFYEAIDVGPSGVIRVLHRDGNLLFSQPHTGPLERDEGADRQVLDLAHGDVAGGFVRTHGETTAGDLLTAWRTLSRVSLVVTVAVAERDALSGWYSELLAVAGSAVGMAGLLAFAGVWITASSRAHARTTTDRDRVGAALERSRVQLQAIMDHSPTGIVLQDAAGRYLLANRRMQEWLGLSEADIRGKTAAQLVGSEAARAVVDGLGAAAGGTVLREATHRFPDGRSRRIVTTSFPVRFADGTTLVGSALTDVTAARDAELQLRQVQKMEAVGQLTGGVAHDFNNLLAVIIGNLDLLEERHEADPEARELIRFALSASLRGAELTRQLLAFSRRQALDPTLIDLNGLVEGTTGMLRRTLGEQIVIETSLAGDLWPALADPSQVAAALTNLAINARDAMPGGGCLSIETANKRLDSDYADRNAGVEAGDYVMLAVSDTGTGIPAEIIDRIFEPFFTTKEAGKGTGLGLSMVYGFAKQSGGHVKVYSEVGHGTTLRLYLPKAGPDADPEAGLAKPALAKAGLAKADMKVGDTVGPAGHATVLVVEDDAEVRAVTVNQLNSLGYAVVQADNGTAALDLLARMRSIDLLFTDVVMPGGMSGPELVRAARAIRPELKVLLTSGYAETAMSNGARIGDAGPLLSKPYRRDDLAMMLRDILGGTTA